jgi:hypothetical protein
MSSTVTILSYWEGEDFAFYSGGKLIEDHQGDFYRPLMVDGFVEELAKAAGVTSNQLTFDILRVDNHSLAFSSGLSLDREPPDWTTAQKIINSGAVVLYFQRLPFGVKLTDIMTEAVHW